MTPANRNLVVTFALVCGLAPTVASGATRQVAPVMCAGQVATIVGTDGDDPNLNGTPGADVIVGLGGNDTIDGGGGNDTICGGDGDDSIDGGAGDDTIDAGAGGDTVDGGPGNDTMAGGDDLDLLFFASGALGVTVDLGKGTAVGDGSDTLSGFEATSGSTGNDTLIGDSGGNFFFPLGGTDVVHGGDGQDFILYLGAVNADLQTGTSHGLDPNNDEGTDTFDGIEGLAGGEGSTLSGDSANNELFFASKLVGRGGDDLLVGDKGHQTLLGGPGADELDGGPGPDRIDGGPGRDVVSYGDAKSVHANLETGRATGDGLDTLQNVESLAGSPGKDILTGNAGPNSLYGKAGDDTLIGAQGDDYLSGGSGTDDSKGGKGSDYCVDSEHRSSCEYTATNSGSLFAAPIRAFATQATSTGASPSLSSEIAGQLRAFRRLRACASRACAAATTAPVAVPPALGWPLGIFQLTAGKSLGDLVGETEGAPACQTRRNRFETWIIAPREIKPIPGTEKATEFVYWSAELKRVLPGGRTGATIYPTSTGHSQISGPGDLNPDATAWLYESNAPHFPYVWRQPVPRRGQYKWVTTIRWQIGQVTLNTLESKTLSHYLQPGNASRPYCDFK